jgi:hypothetical protein
MGLVVESSAGESVPTSPKSSPKLSPNLGAAPTPKLGLTTALGGLQGSPLSSPLTSPARERGEVLGAALAPWEREREVKKEPTEMEGVLPRSEEKEKEGARDEDVEPRARSLQPSAPCTPSRPRAARASLPRVCRASVPGAAPDPGVTGGTSATIVSASATRTGASFVSSGSRKSDETFVNSFVLSFHSNILSLLDMCSNLLWPASALLSQSKQRWPQPTTEKEEVTSPLIKPLIDRRQVM